MKKVISVLLVVVLLLTIYPVAYGVSVKASLNADSTTVKPGETVVIRLRLSDIDMGDGIMSISGALTYDKDVFEEISASANGVISATSLSKMSAINGWTALLYNPNTTRFAMDVSGAAMVSEDNILQISLKVKDGVSNTESTVTVSDLLPSNGFDEVELEPTSIKITIGENTNPDDGDEDVPPVENIVENTVVDDEPTNTNINIVTPTANKTTDKTITTNRIPNAGIAYGIIISVIILAVVVAVSYKKYSSMKDIK